MSLEQYNRMSEAIHALMARYPDRLNVDFEDEVIRMEKVAIDIDPKTKKPLQPLMIEIETEPTILNLAKKDDMPAPTDGYTILEYRLGDTVDKERVSHFQTVDEVIDLITMRIDSH